MSGTENNQIIRIPLQQGQSGEMISHQGVSARFNAAGQLQVVRNGQTIAVYDEKLNVMVPDNVANNTQMDRAPAVLWHRTNGRLTNNDIAKTICDDKDNPIGIYMGVWTPEWARGRQIRVYAAITDVRDENGVRLKKSFNQYVAYLYDHPDGEKLLDLPAHAPDVTYKMASRTRILYLKEGQRTGHMIPSKEILVGWQEVSSGSVFRRDSMWGLQYVGDFTKFDNGGFDSRFATNPMFGGSQYKENPNDDLGYVSSNVSPSGKYIEGLRLHGLSEMTHDSKDYVGWALRPFIAEIPKP